MNSRAPSKQNNDNTSFLGKVGIMFLLH